MKMKWKNERIEEKKEKKEEEKEEEEDMIVIKKNKTEEEEQQEQGRGIGGGNRIFTTTQTRFIYVTKKGERLALLVMRPPTYHPRRPLGVLLPPAHRRHHCNQPGNALLLFLLHRRPLLRSNTLMQNRLLFSTDYYFSLFSKMSVAFDVWGRRIWLKWNARM